MLIYAIIGFGIAAGLFKYVFLDVLVVYMSEVDSLANGMPFLVFFVFIPISVLTGSAITGYCISKNSDTILKDSIIYNPGIFASIAYIAKSISFQDAYRSDSFMGIIFGLLICSLIWIAVSSWGIYLGYKIRGPKIRGQ